MSLSPRCEVLCVTTEGSYQWALQYHSSRGGRNFPLSLGKGGCRALPDFILLLLARVAPLFTLWSVPPQQFPARPFCGLRASEPILQVWEDPTSHLCVSLSGDLKQLESTLQI